MCALDQIDDVMIAALTIGGEMRDRDRECQFIIGNVLHNRLKVARLIRKLSANNTLEKLSEQFGMSLEKVAQYFKAYSMREICLMPDEFKCWQEGSVGHKWINRMIAGEGDNRDRKAMIQLERIAKGWIDEAWLSETKADHYHIGPNTPDWAHERKLEGMIGPMYLYRLFGG